MTKLAEEVLSVLRTLDEKPEYFISDLTSHGFSEINARTAIAELEQNGFVDIVRTFINGSPVFIIL